MGCPGLPLTPTSPIGGDKVCSRGLGATIRALGLERFLSCCTWGLYGAGEVWAQGGEGYLDLCRVHASLWMADASHEESTRPPALRVACNHH